MSFLFRISFLVILLLNTIFSYTQVVYHDIQKLTVYDFLDELANIQAIELNTFSKPYSRELIANKLKEIDRSVLNKRQVQQLEFFLKDFNKEIEPGKDFEKRYDVFYYKDSLFSMTINPLMGGTVWNNKNGTNTHRRNGGEAYGTIAKNWGYYVALHDNQERELLQNENFLNNEPAAVHKGSGDYSDLRVGFTYAWDWGSVGLLKDNYTWGNNNFGANIISNKAPSFARVELKLNPTKWLDFTYYHGWLASEVRDSIRSYNAGARQRVVDVRKFIAANIVTIKPIKYLNISLGNSIVYSDNIQAAFFIPFGFFKSIDHVVYSGSGNFGGQNTQVFFDVSSRNIKGVHLYSSLYIDEISISRLLDDDRHTNFISGKLGVQWSNILNKNIQLTAEYTRTNPITFNHFVNSTTYESNEYILGHYLRDNAQELALEVSFKPISRLNITGTYILAQKGNVFNYSGLSNDTSIQGLNFLEETRWENRSFMLGATYELFNDLIIAVDYLNSNISGQDKELYTPEFFLGDLNTFSFGVRVGF